MSLATLEDRSHPAWQRLKFEELLAQQLSQLQARLERQRQRAPRFAVQAGGLQERLLAALPFGLTAAQRRVVEEIAHDLQREALDPGQRCEGDSAHAPPAARRRRLGQDGGGGDGRGHRHPGRLAVCADGAHRDPGPSKHLRKLVGWLAPLGITVAWLTGSRKGKARAAMLEQVASGEAALVVGTHAVIQDQVRFARLGLAIVDEQHRFGVQQRLALRAKLAAQPDDTGSAGVPTPREATLEPHTLMMSATPIPRTLAMTLFADLDISTIDELPPGRTPVVTKPVRREQARRCGRTHPRRGGPGPTGLLGLSFDRGKRIARSPERHGPLTSSWGAALPDAMVGLLHGRMPAAEKAAVMSLFTGGQMGVLVSTTVIEVGVDVPNASLMVIEHAERFGLSQLHQLRGRVGRGAVASVCVLLYSSPLSDTGKARLKAMMETTDGFEIARRDLEIRGPGEFLGARQSGAPLLRFADLTEDEALVRRARVAAEHLLTNHPPGCASARDALARYALRLPQGIGTGASGHALRCVTATRNLRRETMNLVQRVQDILLKPKETWPTIEAESATPSSIYSEYLIFLAAIPALAGFVGLSLIGVGGMGFGFRIPILTGLVHMVVSFVLALVMVYVLSLIVDALAAHLRRPQEPAQRAQGGGLRQHRRLRGRGVQPAADAVHPRAAGCALFHLPHLHRPAGAHEVPAGQGRGLHRGGDRVQHRRDGAVVRGHRHAAARARNDDGRRPARRWR